MIAVLAAALALQAPGPFVGPAPGPAPTTAPEPELTPTLSYRDGDRRVAAARLGPDRALLIWDDGRQAIAGVGPDAVARLPRDPAARAAALVRAELRVVRALSDHLGIALVRSTRPGEDGLALAARLADDPDLDVSPDHRLARRPASFAPPATDPRRDGQWYLDTIAIDDAWALAVGDPDTVIGVVDNGCDLTHPDLADNLLPGYDVFDGDDDPSFVPASPGNEHGTACAGVIAAVGDNGLGVAGVCPECRVRCVRLLGPDPGDGSGVAVPLSADIEAFDKQREWGVAVSSNSWGYVDRVPVPHLFAQAIRALIDEGRGGLGAVVVFAAGNDAREIYDDELYGIPGLVTVGALNAFDEAAQFSNYGPGVDVTAPAGTLTTDIAGVDGADPGDYTASFGGTSSACPVVAGVAALLASAAPEKTGAELTEALVTSARPAPFALPDEDGHDPLYGYGVVDPLAALARVGVVPPEPEPEPGPEPEPEPGPELGADLAEVVEEPAAPAQPRDGGGCTASEDPGATYLLALALLALLVRRRVRRIAP